MRSNVPLLVIVIQALVAVGCATPSPTDPPEVEYIPDASYYLLMAEIAVQRKEYLMAAQEYLNAAQQSADPELASRATEFAFEYGYDAFALNGVLRWLALAPEDRLGHDYASRLYLRRNDLDRALDHGRLALGPVEARSDEDYLSYGADLAGQANADGATRILTRLTADAPDSTGLRMALARAAFRSGDYELALSSARRAAAGDEGKMDAEILVARALLEIGAEYQALQHMERLLSDNPILSLELEYVQLLASADRNRRARETLRDLVKKYGAHPELVRVHGMMNLADGALKEAERDFIELVKQSADVYEALFYLGQIALIRGDFRDAIRLLERIRGGPYLLPAQRRIVTAYMTLGEQQASLDYLAAFTEDYPRYAVDILETKAQLLHQMGRHDEALSTYDQLIRFRPDSVNLLISRAVLLDQTGHLNDAIRAMEQAVDIAPLNANALNTLGYTLTNRTSRHADAYRLIRLALEIEPDSAPIIDSMGWVLYRQGRLEEARSYLELAYSMLDDPELVAHLGEVLWRTGERERAEEIWDRSLAMNPDSELLKETMARFLP